MALDALIVRMPVTMTGIPTVAGARNLITSITHIRRMASGVARRIIQLTERSIEQSLKMTTTFNPKMTTTFNPGVALKMTGPRLGNDIEAEDTPGPQAYDTGRQLTEREKAHNERMSNRYAKKAKTISFGAK